MSYSNIYLNKRRKKASQSFWSSYQRTFSAVILGAAGLFGLIFCGHRIYENWNANSAEKQITEKLIEVESHQRILQDIGTEIAHNFILPQFNKPIANNENLASGMKHIARIRVNLEIYGNLSSAHRGAWTVCTGFGGAGISSALIDAYNYALKKQAARVDVDYLFLSFEQIDLTRDCCSNLVNGHWQNEKFDTAQYGQLPQGIDWFDVLRKALLIAIREQHQRSKNPIVLVIDSLDELIFTERDFKYLLMFLGAAISQRICAVFSVSPNQNAAELIVNVLSSTYGNLATTIDTQICDFFSESEVLKILQANIGERTSSEGSELLASKLHKITKGYPVLLSAVIMAMNENEVTAEEVVAGSEALGKWFAAWYESVYFANYMVPALKLIERRRMKKILKQIRKMLVGDCAGDMTDSTDIDLMDAGEAYRAAVLFPKHVCDQNDIELTLPIVRNYWKQHSIEHIYNKLLAAMNASDAKQFL